MVVSRCLHKYFGTTTVFWLTCSEILYEMTSDPEYALWCVSNMTEIELNYDSSVKVLTTGKLLNVSGQF